MNARSQLLSWILVSFAVAAGITASLLWRHPAPAQDLTTGMRLFPSQPIADFTLIDHHGRKFGLGQLRGQWTLMFFGYTNCADFCPTTLSTLAALKKHLRAEKASLLPQVVFISVDVQRDTPAHLAAYMPYFDADFIGVTAADQPAIESVAREFGAGVIITPGKDGSYTVDHSAQIFVIDPNARLAAILSGPLSVQALAGDWHHLVGAAT